VVHPVEGQDANQDLLLVVDDEPLENGQSRATWMGKEEYEIGAFHRDGPGRIVVRQGGCGAMLIARPALILILFPCPRQI
jgi:hypothetical protein